KMNKLERKNDADNDVEKSIETDAPKGILDVYLAQSDEMRAYLKKTLVLMAGGFFVTLVGLALYLLVDAGHLTGKFMLPGKVLIIVGFVIFVPVQHFR